MAEASCPRGAATDFEGNGLGSEGAGDDLADISDAAIQFSGINERGGGGKLDRSKAALETWKRLMLFLKP
ncbi:hypothetical protein C4D60_Mb11t21580 [Musa balbisiana]|uniref:Uncharacterized protein n=1 Tax=Musa balbisiana TaxID=52838 RepID=A0A4S8J5S4_MUSBA|nr:hypothetical protein C4D60_Mb11t21580 [Musa balbisiana]